jgi:hypothetical protein
MGVYNYHWALMAKEKHERIWSPLPNLWFERGKCKLFQHTPWKHVKYKSESILLIFLNFWTRCWTVVRFTTLLLCPPSPRENGPGKYKTEGSMGSRAWLGPLEKRKSPSSSGNRTVIPQSSSPLPSHDINWAIPCLQEKDTFSIFYNLLTVYHYVSQ